MKVLLIILVFMAGFIVVASLNVDASGLTSFYQIGVSKTVYIILYVIGFIGLVSLKRMILK